jgi:hypothetical protein
MELCNGNISDGTRKVDFAGLHSPFLQLDAITYQDVLVVLRQGGQHLLLAQPDSVAGGVGGA